MIFDTHSDLFLDVKEKRTRGLRFVIRDHHLKRLKDAGVFAGMFPLWIDSYANTNLKKEGIRSLLAMSAEISESYNCIKLIQFKEDLSDINKEDKLGIVLGTEGLCYIGENEDAIDLLFLIGMRVMSFTWNEENQLATGADGDPKRGLTEAGKKCLKRMEQLDILVDVSHANDKTFWDIMERTTGPIIASHSNCRSLCAHPRNLTDEQLKEISLRDGFVGLNSWPLFVGSVKEKQTIENMVNHLCHMVDIMGIDHIGFGFDLIDFLDENDTNPKINPSTSGFKTIKDTRNLLLVLRERGFSDQDIKKICYENILKILIAKLPKT